VSEKVLYRQNTVWKYRPDSQCWSISENWTWTKGVARGSMRGISSLSTFRWGFSPPDYALAGSTYLDSSRPSKGL